MNPMTELLELFHGYTTQRNPYGRQPCDVMIVTSVSTNFVYCRHEYEDTSSYYPYNFLTNYAPAVGSRVLVQDFPGGPVIVGALQS